jgi:hypothetical protein
MPWKIMLPDGRRVRPRALRLLFFVLLSLPVLVIAQSPPADGDTVKAETKVKKSSIFAGRPGRAMLYSLVIPGTGQIYNKSYLRVPFVWGAVGGMGYLVHYNSVRYKCLDAAYRAAVDQVPFVPTENCPEDFAMDLALITDPSRLRALRDEANRNRQLSIIGFSLVWLANGIDAYVNAHLKEFDVTDDLSIGPLIHVGDDPFAPVQYGAYLRF